MQEDIEVFALEGVSMRAWSVAWEERTGHKCRCQRGEHESISTQHIFGLQSDYPVAVEFAIVKKRKEMK